MFDVSAFRVIGTGQEVFTRPPFPGLSPDHGTLTSGTAAQIFFVLRLRILPFLANPADLRVREVMESPSGDHFSTICAKSVQLGIHPPLPIRLFVSSTGPRLAPTNHGEMPLSGGLRIPLSVIELLTERQVLLDQCNLGIIQLFTGAFSPFQPLDRGCRSPP